MLLDVVLAMLLSIRTKYETKTVNCYFIVDDFAQKDYDIFGFFFTTESAKLNGLTAQLLSQS